MRTYLLVNPPYAKDIKENLRKSIDYALKKSDSIVLINLLPHGNTPLMRKWLSGEWNYLGKEDFRKLTAKYKSNPKIEFDEETFKFTPMFPEKRMLSGVGEEYLTHPYFEVWQDYINRWYKPPEGKSIVLFLPCSFKKPYSESETHRAIISVLRRLSARTKVHEVMLSNAGVIPREFEDYYPFNAYDWDEKLETKEIKERYTKVTADRIKNYLKAHASYYDRVACYLRYDSESYQALESACSEMKIRLENMLSKETQKKFAGESSLLKREDALADLEGGVKCLLQNSM
jgi:archaeosine synthase